MPIIETKYSPQESLRRVHSMIELMHKHLREHALHNVFNRVISDSKILENEYKLKGMLSKFDDGSMKQFYADAKNLGHLAKTHHNYIPHIKQSLRQIEELLIRMRKMQVLEMRKAVFLAKMANYLSREVRNVEREVNITQNKIEKYMRNFKAFK